MRTHVADYENDRVRLWERDWSGESGESGSPSGSGWTSSEELDSEEIEIIQDIYDREQECGQPDLTSPYKRAPYYISG